MTTEEIKGGLIKAGIRNLKEFGYPEVTTENILTDIVYRQFFESMLKDNKGQSNKADVAIDELISEIQSRD